MRRIAKSVVVVLAASGVAAASVWAMKAHRKAEPPIAPKPLTQAQIRKFFPGTTGTVVIHPDKFILYTIDPMQLEFALDESKTPYLSTSLNGFKIRGKTIITDPNDQAGLLASAFSSPSFDQHQCFMPHHALRMVKNKRTVDVIICFGCGTAQIWENGEPKTGDLPANRPALPYVNQVLAAHHITPPK